MQKVNENSRAKHEFTKRNITFHRMRKATKEIHMFIQKTQSHFFLNHEKNGNESYKLKARG